MIGKIIADFSGLTEKLDGKKNGKLKTIKKIDTEIEVDKTEWNKFQHEVKAAKGDTVKIKTAIDNSAFKDLKEVEELYNYAVSKSQSGQNVRLKDINNLIQTQNYKNIADQAHGFLGVKKAINEYKNIEKYIYKTNVKYFFLYF